MPHSYLHTLSRDCPKYLLDVPRVCNSSVLNGCSGMSLSRTHNELEQPKILKLKPLPGVEGTKMSTLQIRIQYILGHSKLHFHNESALKQDTCTVNYTPPCIDLSRFHAFVWFKPSDSSQ